MRAGVTIVSALLLFATATARADEADLKARHKALKAENADLARKVAANAQEIAKAFARATRLEEEKGMRFRTAHAVSSATAPEELPVEGATHARLELARAELKMVLKRGATRTVNGFRAVSVDCDVNKERR